MTMLADAMISIDGRYRYRLTREWDATAQKMTFVMLNPSTADATLDDPTIRRCIGFAQRDGFGGIYVVNLYAFRATEPKDMKRAIDPVGPENDALLRFAFRRSAEQHAPVIAAWGTHGDPYRVRQVRGLMTDAGADVYSLGVTKDGHPKHPLYIKADQRFERWPVPALANMPTTEGENR